MMNNRKFFTGAVIIAFVVPLVMGGIYFSSVYKYKGNSEYVSSLEDSKELIVIGDKKIDSDNLKILKNEQVQAGNMLEFFVKYSFGPRSFDNYRVTLNEVSISPNVEAERVKWSLALYDKNKQKFKFIDKGTFKDYKFEHFTIGPNINIGLGELQKLRLYYYMTDKLGEQVKGDISLKVDVE